MKKSNVYAIVDIETTGGLTGRDRITEIAIVVFDGSDIIDKFETLINPERSIPVEITRITGITNEMVAQAPKFYEVARKIVDITDGCVFVAHNVRFDYNFIKEEFLALGYTYTRKVLCTVQLSRKAFPGLRSYSLGNLIRHFDIQVLRRHRAMDDVLATVDVFSRILRSGDLPERIALDLSGTIRQNNLPAGITREKLDQLPEAPGVYYMANIHGTIIYVGKSINIKSRILQHFSQWDKKTEKLSQKVHDITFELTGNELVAMLKESRDIKLLQPEVNKAQRTREYPYFIFSYTDDQGYLCLDTGKAGKKNEQQRDIVSFYGTKESARSQMQWAWKNFMLCPAKCHMENYSGDCFYYRTGECLGAALGKESTDTYNERVNAAVDAMTRHFEEDFVLVEKGREASEVALIWIEKGHYRGFGYLQETYLKKPFTEWKSCIQEVKPNPELNRIIQHYLSVNPQCRMIYMSQKI